MNAKKRTWFLAGMLLLASLAVVQLMAVTVTPSDESITAAVKDKIYAAKDLKDTDIQVDTDHGVVTLQGTVATQEQVDHAVSLAEHVKHVKSVNSQLAVGKSDDSSSELGKLEKEAKNGIHKAGQTVEDASISTEITLKYAKDDTVKATKIDVDTNLGVVTLKGTVSSQTEADRAIQLAREVEGVKEVRSNLTIKQ